MTHEEHVLLQRQRALSVAYRVLEGSIGPTAGARLLCAFRGGLGFGEEEAWQLFSLFVGVDSETDHLPLGPERQYWNQEALERKDLEIARSDAAWGDDVRAACRTLVERLKTPFETELVEALDEHDRLVRECALGTLPVGDFLERYGSFYLKYALDGHESGAEEQAFLQRYEPRISLHREITESILYRLTSEAFAGNPEFAAAGFIGQDEAFRRLEALARKYLA